LSTITTITLKQTEANANRSALSPFSFSSLRLKISLGGVVGVYSNRIFHPCDYTPVISYKYKKIIFVTDGLCGSTCAVFSSHLDEVDNVDSVAIGGYAGTKCSVLFSLKFCHYAFDLSSIVKRRNQRFRRVGVM
jgi:hypothetical protein